MRSSDGTRTRPRIVVAGHICLDVIASIPTVGSDPATEGERPLTPDPGTLDVIGPATLAIGGCVGNTGVAIHRLGVDATLVARVGDDAMGGVLEALVSAAIPTRDRYLIRMPGAATSYSLIHNRPGTDRAIQHFPGVNDSFVAADVPEDALAGATLLHVGYPPLMAALAAEDGAELRALLSRARASGVATSLDLANVRLGPSDRPMVAWDRVLERVLPSVDVFLPSFEEASRLLHGEEAHDGEAHDGEGRGRAVDGDLEVAAALADRMLDMGVAIAGVKLGTHGLLVRTAGRTRLGTIDGLDLSSWADRELHSTVFETDVEGTTGAGDATIAGFLFALLSQMGPEDAMTAACAVGGVSTERADGTSGVPGWREIERRLAGGWRRRSAGRRAGWTQIAPGMSSGPRDRYPAKGGGASRRS